MSLDQRHPLFAEFFEDWRQMRDTYRGERVVKQAGVVYLPFTQGMILDGADKATDTTGWKAWSAYRKRARFPGVVKDGVESMLGVMHHKPPKITLPAKMEPMRARATSKNESLEMLLRRINEEQLVTGRVGIMLDLPAVEQLGLVLPYVALYRAEDLINWDEGETDKTKPDALNLVVIDESEDERTNSGFDWKRVQKFRVLVLGAFAANEQQGAGVYRSGVFRDSVVFSESELVVPKIAGRTLDEIPFEFVNAKDVVPTPDEAPLLDLSNLALTIYRGEADYRQALFMQGQDTLVTIGALNDDGTPKRTGTGASIDLPIGGDAKFIGVDSSGLPEMREALVNDYARAKERADSLIETTSRAAESGEALRVRVASRTAALNQVALAGAFALQSLLRKAAKWLGINPEEVVVEPNLDFVGDVMPARELVDTMAAKKLGAPLSLESVHNMARSRGLTDKTFEEELETMQREADEGLPGSTTAVEDEASTNPDGPAEDEEPGEGEPPGKKPPEKKKPAKAA